MANEPRTGGERVLELFTLAPVRRYLTIDGDGYDIIGPDEIDAVGLATLVQVENLNKIVQGIDWENPTDDDVAKADALNRMADKAVRLLMPGLPDHIRRKLTFMQKMRIMQVFQVTPAETTAETETPGAAESPSTGESGPPDSSDSTEAETPASG